MEITILGIGMGSPATLTGEAKEALLRADCVVGARRILDSLPPEVSPLRLAAVSPADIVSHLDARPELRAPVVAMSGDTGFYSGCAGLLPLLEGRSVRVLCGVTTAQYLAAKLRRPWQNVKLVSAHGTDCDVVGQVLSAPEVFFLTGGTVTPKTIAADLCRAGLGRAELAVGENLSYPDESVTTGTAQELCESDFAPLSAVWVRCPVSRPAVLAPGLPDEEFLRGEVPMTKQEVRAAVLAKLGVKAGDTVYDVGAGTGSVGVEVALLSPLVKVYAAECLPEACQLIRANREKFGAYNLTLAEGTAPAVLADFPPPDRAFVGGSRGNLREILSCLLEKNPHVRVVVSAIAAETFAEALSCFRELGLADVEISQISVARSRKAGRYHMMTGQNPIFLLCAGGLT